MKEMRLADKFTKAFSKKKVHVINMINGQEKYMNFGAMSLSFDSDMGFVLNINGYGTLPLSAIQTERNQWILFNTIKVKRQ